MAIEALAPAKINLTLHVTGQREDGYHLLDSLVVFAEAGDRILVEPADDLRLTVTGPKAAGIPADGDNLVLRAARMLGQAGQGAAITLEKHLPMASGIGGGSSDAAATLRALARLWAVTLPPAIETARLGADVPVCLDPRPRRMAGLGEILSDVPQLPPLWLVLVNPGVPLATPAVFRALTQKTNPAMPDPLPNWSSAMDLADFLRSQRNDLEPPALAIQPVIGTVLAALAACDGCLLARMSGSGATCFGLFASAASAASAACALAAGQPGWWVSDSAVLA
ncbi:4-(cytidine 5'-diphospho)-2-C-methyl-D-erythritol kinase [Rhodobacter veldkampii DSM 11550]|uniref:4-diphosphocytidyl-2-C-methyl-D-erythritol kinase n=1 Tax=Phaeovulum veldkampii DSM 11550 TaxID=1185920 RepID=A0A2T4JGZ5_9RHOB|nr:4-(cytidine 5'-diphospho)-2-C-methyl-D-erythritol kinase [Phaeovulum veldkampii]MBK5945252.1 4-(cytidine 5'-diphospho)-2-C-methyl-D-erythritol kinase [Phaeovulum veldkampii DSM 11550]PTE17185.1 4-(cytidine 5'-diphospho)-2-C-methyl-D-erythritol kinase [Phaeovulum veldkampii DSM 11550]TDQ61440.1 4-diphosphocytidyl-2-C-methyl-D-erythritol kinase [Phaeovulum veldkampii DSM 11550]